jgi:hypothetical protein
VKTWFPHFLLSKFNLHRYNSEVISSKAYHGDFEAFLKVCVRRAVGLPEARS